MAGTLSEGIVKINSKALEAAELKRLDKQEKEFIFMTHGSVKGRKNFRILDQNLFDQFN
jgi:hypothetical protein